MQLLRLCEHSFLADQLTSGSVVVDLGLNRGRFATMIAERFGCRIYGAEPDPELFRSLPEVPRLTKLQVAIGGVDGTVPFHLNAGMCSSVLFEQGANRSGSTISVPVMTLRQFLRMHKLDRVQLIKVDVEGAEVAMIDSATDEDLVNIEQITVEFHVFMDSSLAPAVQRIRHRMSALGFYDIDLSRSQMDVLFVNLRHFQLSRVARFGLHAFKYSRGAGRVMGRLFGRHDEPSFEVPVRTGPGGG